MSLVARGGALGLALALTLSSAAAQQIEDAPAIKDSIEAALPLELNRAVDERLPRVTIDRTGDVTVVFAMRYLDDVASVREAAYEDTLAVLRAVYTSPEVERVTSTTVLGTFSVIGKRSTSREQPVLRAVLSADRAHAVNWSSVQPTELPAQLDTWWLHAAFGDTAALRAAPPIPSRPGVIPVDAEGRPHEALSRSQVRQQLDLMLVHLNEAIFALSGNEVRIARSQFKQFFEEWDRAEEETSELYPERYELLDLELERAEIALFHRFPEDLVHEVRLVAVPLIRGDSRPARTRPLRR